ncbi:S9 family peptidase [Prolixibacter sp. NT017]|uniref:S9 family peptidase n=1 Tax=Prolixibacter sp. NT017 TaxID=2652390 RepID=UPI00127393BB|nr:S9 family peptidase [Prolixibacter sp. NT017]GET25592.1 peptidase [Prolixibacter sp. NT017]
MKYLLLAILLGFLSLVPAKAQVTKADYARADSVREFAHMVYNSPTDGGWIGKSNVYWYRVRTKNGIEYKRVDAEHAEVSPAFDRAQLCEKINELSDKSHHPDSLDLRRLKFDDAGKSVSFHLDGYTWEYNLDDYMLKKTGKVETPESRYWGNTDGEFKADPIISPDSSKVAYIKEYNLYVKDRNTGTEEQLSFDGSAGEFYSEHLVWSPDSKKIAVNKVRPNKKHYIYFVESSPKNQLQPILHKREYLKAGDALPIRKPCLFNVEKGRKIPVNSQPFENQFSISNLKWWPDSKAFTFEFNQRGHQVYQVVEVNAETGGIKVLINEQSKTFIDYSGKHYLYDLDGTKEIVWASERDGWNHLYLIDANTGKVKNKITSGDWVVRGVVSVDEKNRKIIFEGSGKNEGEDPYFIHYYSVNLDGKKLKDLTPEKLNHHASFSSDNKFLIDTYSTVDTPPETVLRRASDGKILKVLEKADISELLAHDWKAPEVFVAKARDGKTDIWGNIYYPTNFDSTKTYPVIEYIYAGPQGSFAQKSFRPYMYAFSGLAELGFIVVQMDGMGTSNRSKAFQDVCFKNLKDAGFPDRIRWIKAAAEKHHFMDTTRVGIFGGSAGGQNAMAGVLFHPEFYKAASSSCGCHDNRMDKMWWNEQWMGYPIGKEYGQCSNVANAYRLKGKLLLIVGEMDDNVDPATTMQVADALIKANKEFELVVLPGSNHTLGGDFGERKRREFFVKAFYGELPPDWNHD